MKNFDNISIFQISLILINFVSFSSQLLIMSPLIQTAGRDSWLSVLLSFILSLLWILIIINTIIKTNKQNLINWLSTRYNQGLASCFRWVFLLLLIIIGGLTARETVTWLNITFLQETPKLIPAIIIGLFCLYLSNTSLKTISNLNIILLFIMLFFGCMLTILNIPYSDFSLLLPFNQKGFIPIVIGALFPLSSLGDLFIVVLIQHRIVGQLKYKHLLILIIILTSITVISLIGILTEFGALEAARQRFPASEEWGIFSSSFIQTIDNLSIFQYLSSTVIRLSVLLFCIKDLLLVKRNNVKWHLIVIVFIIEIFIILPLNDVTYTYRLFFQLVPSIACCFFVLSLLLCVLILIQSKRSRKDEA